MGALIAILALVFITGLCIGSFLNVVILRTLSEESIVFPASKCPKCQTPLKWWHNIPVLSYILLRGKCAFCKEPISIQYPIIELITGIIYTILFMKFGVSFDTLFAWIFAALLIVIAGTDIKEKVVYDVHTYTLIGFGLLYAVVVTATAIYQIHVAGTPIEFSKYILLNNPLSMSILGAIEGALILEICARAGYLVAGTRAFGEGDTFIAAGLGALFGWRTLLVVLALSVLIQVVLFLPIFVKGLIQNKDFKTLISFVLFCAYAITFYSLQHFRIITPENIIIYTIGALILAALGITSCIFIFKGLREKPENRTYLPFGPAMVAAAFIALIL
ncbi:hypothetical protein BHV42_02525 [Candidatus Melainabacteria bacterium MEL.A1]|jgi:type 4 prepilin peptidase|nr:hypothetical protein BHV42_02525 [Candidatus Melainabacteria bacterium MEL.A1]CCX80685.1 type 4 prepilin-like proteins leader peptide-processing enzyme [Clostridium sp. CAG:715]DAA83732.1 MAG TPA: hypothetical protein CPT82_05600 [Candidatus Gastranaerophilales bacterium HUM_2]